MFDWLSNTMTFGDYVIIQIVAFVIGVVFNLGKELGKRN